MADILQNTYIWVLPNSVEKNMKLKSNQNVEWTFTECYDGKFSYEVWVYTQNDKNVKIKMDIDNNTIYENMKIPSSDNYSWKLYGNFQVAKGEHKISLKNNDDFDVNFEGILITRDSSYVHNGIATKHIYQLQKGRSIGDLLIESGIELSSEETNEEKEKRLKNLYRMGFLERFDQDLSEGRCRNGVPMGGIGAGKIELDKDGVFTSITINNNCEVPIFKTEGSFFGVWCKRGENKTAKILQKKNYNKFNFPTIDDIEYDGVFPTANLKYIDKDLPVDISLKAYSFLIPNDIKNSSIPAVVFDFVLSNNTNETIDTSIMFSMENLIGTGGSMVIKSKSNSKNNSYIMNTWNPAFTWSDRTGNYQKSKDNYISFKAKSDNLNKSSFGEYTLMCDEKDVTFNNSWNIYEDGESLWQKFSDDGTLKTEKNLIGDEEKRYIAGAISKKISLKKGESRKISFIFSWFMPYYIDADFNDMGVYYSNNFKNSLEVCNYVKENKEMLLNKTLHLHSLIFKSSLPVWLSKKLINDMFPIYTCSWFSKDKKFAINEAPTGMMGCLGTIDQRLACNVIYTNLFKDLDFIELDLFRKCQGKNGSISHDLGFGKFDIRPVGGTWSDLCSSFILQVYKYYIYTGDDRFLNLMYPCVKRAVNYQISIDYDKNGIPDVGAGNGTTYDTYHWYGTSSFVASLWLSELRCCVELARFMKDDEFSRLCTDLFDKAQKSMIDELWNEKYSFGSYFNNYNDKINSKHSENCFIAQLAGQWFTDLMDLKPILSKDKIQKSIKTIFKRNVEIKNIMGMNDETTPEGDFAGYGYTFAQYDEVYFGCLAIYNDFVKEGLTAFKKVYDMSVKSPWNVVLTYFTSGEFTGLPYYMTNPASFFVLEALSGFVPNMVEKTLKISPHIEGENISIPLFSPYLWLWLDYKKSSNFINIKIKPEKVLKDNVFFKTFITEVPENIFIKSVKINGKDVAFKKTLTRLYVEYDLHMVNDEFNIEIIF